LGEVAEPDLDGGGVDGAGVNEGALLVTGCDSPELLELADAACDDVAALVGLDVERDQAATCCTMALAPICWTVFSGMTALMPRRRRRARMARLE
jgi:hypothetical protein